MSSSINRIIELEQQASAIGFAWPDAQMILDQVISECQEVRQALKTQESSPRIQEEVGDVLHAAICLCAFLGFGVEETLSATANKFETRFKKMQEIAKEQGYSTLKGQPISNLLQLWDLAKKSC